MCVLLLWTTNNELVLAEETAVGEGSTAGLLPLQGREVHCSIVAIHLHHSACTRALKTVNKDDVSKTPKLLHHSALPRYILTVSAL